MKATICKVRNGKDYIGDIQIWDEENPIESIAIKGLFRFESDIELRHVANIRFSKDITREEAKFIYDKMKEVFGETMKTTTKEIPN